MEHTDTERLIDIISWGKISIHHSPTSLVIRNPTPEEKARAAILYTRTFETAISSGMLTNDQTLSAMKEFGKWSSQMSEVIDGLKKDIHNLRRGMLDFLFNRSKLEYTRKLLRNAEKVLTMKLLDRQELLKSSAETHATLAQQRFLISKITETEDGLPYWSSTSSFDDETDTVLVHRLCRAFFETNIPTSTIRNIARSDQWRLIWNAVKQFGNVFGSDNTQWSQAQIGLVHWSIAYDHVYEAYERPSDEIIEDDDLLDSWFIRQHEQICDKTKQNIGNNVLKDQKSQKSGRNEQFIMADKEGAKQIYAMNDPMVRAKLRARQKVLSEKGSVSEQHMPDSQVEMRQQLVNMQRQHVKNIGSR